MRQFTIGLALAAGLTASPAFATNLVSNGDFSQLTNGFGQITNGTITEAIDWATSGYNFVMGSATKGGSISLWDASNGGATTWNGKTLDGSNFLAMDGAYHTAAVSQTVSGLTIGQKYTLAFNYAFAQQHGYNGATIQNLTASVGSASLTTADYNLANHGFSGWLQGALTFTASSTSEKLSFLAYGNLPVPPFALVSNVSVAAVPGPEAGVGLLPLVAFGALMFARRRFSRNADLAA